MAKSGYFIGPKIGVEGEAEFRKEMDRITESVKTYTSELQLLDAQYGADNKSVEKLTAQHTALADVLAEQTEKVGQLEKMVQKSTEKLGESDKATQKYTQMLNAAKIDVIKTTQALEQNEDALTGLSEATGDHLADLKKLEDEYQKNKKAVREQQEEFKGLKSELDKAEKALDSARKSTSQSNEEIERQATEVEKLRTALGKQESQLKDTSRETERLKAELKQTSGSLVEAGEAAEKATKELKGMGGNLEDVTDATKDANDGFLGGITSIGDLKDKILSANPVIAALAAVIGTAVKQLADITTKAAAAADEINTLSKTTGLSVEEVQKFRYASELVDVSMDTLSDALSKTSKSMDEMKAGSGTAGEALKSLHIRLKDSKGQAKSSSEIFYEVSAALGKIKDPAERDALAMKIFGESARNLNPLILGGAEALKEYGDAMEKAGMVLDQQQLDRLNAMNDQIDTMKSNFDQLGMIFSESTAESIVPSLEKINELLLDNVDAIQALGKITGLGVDFLSGIFEGAIAPLKIVLDLIGKLDSSLGKLEGKLGQLAKFVGKSIPRGMMGIPGLIGNVSDLIKIFQGGCATGTSSATPGLHVVSEGSGPEIISARGKQTLVPGPALVNFQGGEQVLNAAQTKAVMGNRGADVSIPGGASTAKIEAAAVMAHNDADRIVGLLTDIKNKLNMNTTATGDNVFNVNIDPTKMQEIDQLLTFAKQAQIMRRKRGL